ncbi:MAG: hypothetical protein KY392_02920 [Chloroflexi bacterium]|nr:hypothetical protein [Chloroflexota bacterium]
MPEISHVRIEVPDQGALNRILREGGAQLFPQWLYAEPGNESRIRWWGIRAAPVQMLDVPDPEDGRHGLFPRPVDDWTEAPRGLVLVTADLHRAEADLEPGLGADWHDAGTDEIIGARCRRMALGRSELVLAQPAGEGYAATALDRRGEGPVAVALDGTTAVGRRATHNPVDMGPATYVRVGPGTAPWLIFLPAAG